MFDELFGRGKDLTQDNKLTKEAYGDIYTNQLSASQKDHDASELLLGSVRGSELKNIQIIEDEFGDKEFMQFSQRQQIKQLQMAIEEEVNQQREITEEDGEGLRDSKEFGSKEEESKEAVAREDAILADDSSSIDSSSS